MIKMIKVLNILMAGGLIIFLPWGQRTIQPVPVWRAPRLM